MLTQPHFTADVSARLDVLLSVYLQAHGVEPHPIACPPWRNHGGQPVAQDHASFDTADGARPASRESLVHSHSNRHFD